MDFEDFDDDSLYVDDDGLEDDASLTIVDEARINLVEAMEKIITELKEKIQLNEKTAASISFTALLRHASSYAELESLEDSGASDEEIAAKIDEIMKQTTEITLSNMDEILNSDTEVETSKKKQIDLDMDDDGTDGATDF